MALISEMDFVAELFNPSVVAAVQQLYYLISVKFILEVCRIVFLLGRGRTLSLNLPLLGFDLSANCSTATTAQVYNIVSLGKPFTLIDINSSVSQVMLGWPELTVSTWLQLFGLKAS